MSKLAPCWRCSGTEVKWTSGHVRIALCAKCHVRLEAVDQHQPELNWMPSAELDCPAIGTGGAHSFTDNCYYDFCGRKMPDCG